MDIRILYETERWSTRKIAKEKGISSSTVNRRLKEAGVKLRPKGAVASFEVRIQKLTDTEASYIAGILDGEGTIYFHKNGPRIIIGNTHRELMEWLSTLLKRNLTQQKGRTPSGERKTPFWVLSVYRKADVLFLLEQISPYVIVKKEKVERAIKMLLEERGSWISSL